MIFTPEEETAILARSNAEALLGQDVLRELRVRYSEPRRHYHDWAHALSVLSWVNTVCEHCHVPSYDHGKLVVAALFHDAIYVVGAKDNEARSVELLRKLHRPEQRAVERLIMDTAGHGKLEAEDVDAWSALLLDCDIATFGEPRWEVAKWNDDNVTAELLSVYTPEQVREGRSKFLHGMLAKRSVFLSDYFRTRYEGQARANIARLAALATGDT